VEKRRKEGEEEDLSEPVAKEIGSEFEIVIVADDEIWFEREHDQPGGEEEYARYDRDSNLSIKIVLIIIKIILKF
jgi:hypothetical protein